jgi:hypothetical protein
VASNFSGLIAKGRRKLRLADGEGMVRIAKTLGLGTGTVQKVKREMAAA